MPALAADGNTRPFISNAPKQLSDDLGAGGPGDFDDDSDLFESLPRAATVAGKNTSFGKGDGDGVGFDDFEDGF